MKTNTLALIALTGVIVLSWLHQAFSQPYATARYNPADGSIYLYETTGIRTVGLESGGLFITGLMPQIGDLPAQAYDASVIAWFSSTGLPAGLFDIGRVLPPGLAATEIVLSTFAASGDEFVGPTESFPADPAASATYNSNSGVLIVDIGLAAQGLLFETADLFNIGASPLLGALAPSQFDSKNLMFFNNDAPLPTGTFNLGAVLPPGLTVSQISLATKGNGIAVGIPVTVVPEPAAGALAFAAAAAFVGRRRKRV